MNGDIITIIEVDCDPFGSPDWLLPVIIGGSSLIFILIVGCICCACMKKNKSKDAVQFHPAPPAVN